MFNRKYHTWCAYNITLYSHAGLPLPSYQNLAYEIILTLGQAFEVAYQLALQARKSGHGSSTLPESFDSKPSKPVPKPRVNIRKSVSIAVAGLFSKENFVIQDGFSPLTFQFRAQI